MSKFAAYQTNKRKFDDGGRGGRGGGRGGPDDEKRPRREPAKPRVNREPGLNIYIDQTFNYWNLPVKAKVLLISNVPEVSLQFISMIFHLLLRQSANRTCFTTSSPSTGTWPGLRFSGFFLFIC